MHMALFNRLSLVLALGTVGALGIILMLAHLSGVWKSPAAKVQIPDPPAVPCKQQSWYNADRSCLTWTATHDIETASADSDRNAAAIGRIP
jgi:hypothetical protein